MTEEEKFAAYEKMHEWVKDEVARLTEKLEKLKAEEKSKTVAFRESLGWRTYSKGLLELYERFGL